jgi:hypothetical protein
MVPSVFSLALSRPSVDSPQAGGVLAIGGIPDIPYEGEFVSVSINPIVQRTYAFYSIPVAGYKVVPASSQPLSSSTISESLSQTTVNSAANSAPLITLNNAGSSTNSLKMVIDSGTTLIYLPSDQVEDIASKFQPAATYDATQDLYTVDCGAQAPQLGIVINGTTFWLDERDLISRGTFPASKSGRGAGATAGSHAGERHEVRLEDVGSEQEANKHAKRQKGSGVTQSSFGACPISVQKQGDGDAVLGDAFLKNVIAVFDVGQNVMRFAARKKY